MTVEFSPSCLVCDVKQGIQQQGAKDSDIEQQAEF